MRVGSLIDHKSAVAYNVVMFMNNLAKEAPADVLDIMARVVATLLRKIEVPEEEVSDFTEQIKERKMGELFANFEPYSVAETRRISRAEGKEEGVKEGDISRLVRQICRKLERGKDLATICDEVEEQETIVKPIYDIAIGYAPDYSPEKVMEQLGKTVSDENV